MAIIAHRTGRQRAGAFGQRAARGRAARLAECGELLVERTKSSIEWVAGSGLERANEGAPLSQFPASMLLPGLKFAATGCPKVCATVRRDRIPAIACDA